MQASRVDGVAAVGPSGGRPACSARDGRRRRAAAAAAAFQGDPEDSDDWRCGRGDQCHGLTLYWFAPTSARDLEVHRIVRHLLAAGYRQPAGRAGRHGQARDHHRPGGAVQATYDGHPLYTYIGDRSPGQAQRQ